MSNEIALKVLDPIRAEIAVRLTGSQVSPEMFMSIASRMVNENLKECHPGSITKAVLSVATLGLCPDPTLGNAYILPYKQKDKQTLAQLIVGYKGYIVLASRAGYEVLQYGAIHENDTFVDAPAGEAPTFSKARSDRGKLEGAFVVTKSIQTGSLSYLVMWEDEISIARKASRSESTEYSPWKTHPDAMYIKTVFRRHLSKLPLADRYKQVIANESELEFEDEKEINPECRELKLLREKLNLIEDTEFREAEIDHLKSEWSKLSGKIPDEDFQKGNELLELGE